MSNAGKTYYFTATNFNYRTTADDIYTFFSQIGNITELYLFINSRNESRGVAVIGFDTPAISIPGKGTTVLFEGRRVKLSTTKKFDLDSCQKIMEELHDHIDFSHKRDFILDPSLIRDAITPDPSFLPPKVPIAASLIEEQAKKAKENKSAIFSVKNESASSEKAEKEEKPRSKEKDRDSDKKNKKESKSDRDRRSEYDFDYDREIERERSHSRSLDRERERERSRDRYLEYDRDRERERSRDHGREHKRERRHEHKHERHISQTIQNSYNQAIADYLNLASRIPLSVLNPLNVLPVDLLRTLQNGMGTSTNSSTPADLLKLQQDQIDRLTSASPLNLVGSHLYPHHQSPLVPPSIPPPPPSGTRFSEERESHHIYPPHSSHSNSPPPPPSSSLVPPRSAILQQQRIPPPPPPHPSSLLKQPPPPPPPHSSSILKQPPPPSPPRSSSLLTPPPPPRPNMILNPPPVSRFPPPPPPPPRQVVLPPPPPPSRIRSNYPDDRIVDYRTERSRDIDYIRSSHEIERERIQRERERRYESDRIEERRYRRFDY